MPYPTQAGQVGGHEGVGIVHKLGPGSENGRVKVGDRVGIKARSFDGFLVESMLTARSGLPTLAVHALHASKERTVCAL